VSNTDGIADELTMGIFVGGNAIHSTCDNEHDLGGAQAGYTDGSKTP
jgi:hypothetical protein